MIGVWNNSHEKTAGEKSEGNSGSCVARGHTMTQNGESDGISGSLFLESGEERDGHTF